MSYDLTVYGREAVEPAALRALVVAAGLAVDDDTGDGFTVVRGARRTYTFGLGGPDQLEPEDVPDEITQVLLGATVVYTVVVEGSSSAAIPHAVRFARRLAAATDGAVLDQQEGVWSRGKRREITPVAHGLTDVVEIHWYAPPHRDVAQLWLELARRHLPEALPRRFGSYEPLPGRLDRDGDDAFVATVAADDTVFLAPHRPVVGGHLAGGADRGPTHVHGLTVLREPLGEPAWRAALQRLFVGFARATGSWFASAEVLRGIEWNGRSLAYGAEAERGVYLAARGAWSGLLPYPAWWTWFGPDYADLVRDHLPATQEPFGDGLFHAWDGPPLDRDELLTRTPVSDLPPRRWWQRRTPATSGPTWLPADLVATTAERTHPGRTAWYGPAGPAVRVPKGLRRRT